MVSTQASQPDGFGRAELLRVVRLVHPFPSFLNAAATVGLAFAAADGDPDAAIVARMTFAMLLAQFAIGAANDVFDRQLDSNTKPWKPIPSGLVPVPGALLVVALCLIGALALGVTLGWASFGLLCLGTACGLAYDARLKRTIFSAVPFMVAIPTLPAWVYVTLDAWESVLWWLLPLGALIGLAVHLANTAPDIESDAANGVRGLAHRLGEGRAVVASWLSFGAALVLAAALWPALDANARWYATTVLIGAWCLFAAIAVYIFLGKRGLGPHFGLIAVASGVAAGGWLAAVT
jgi:4-hydroxybenzoate polyprenyltransferase